MKKIGRRNALKFMGKISGSAWITPVVLSVGLPAHATTSQLSGQDSIAIGANGGSLDPNTSQGQNPSGIGSTANGNNTITGDFSQVAISSETQ